MKCRPRGTAAALFSLVLGCSGPALAGSDAGISAELRAEIQAATKGDLASSMTAAVDNSGVLLSSKSYRAIQAVERYRKSAQWKTLTVAERNFDNFDIAVNAPERALSLRGDEKQSCYEIVLWPRLAPGEKVTLDTPAKLGRSALYVVRKSDNRILRAELDNPKRWERR
jgi:hypothetical protein